MNIFNVIKYPISNPPKVEELEALPKNIFKTWVNRHFSVTMRSPAAVSDLFHFYYDYYDCAVEAKLGKELHWLMEEQLQELINEVRNYEEPE